MDRFPNETARKIAEKALSHVARELAAGRSEALLNYLTVMSRFRRFSWRNVLLIAAQRPYATQIAGIHTWNDLGRSIKKGEKGILIFAPAEVGPEPARGKLLHDPFARAGFRAAYVFDVVQTAGKPLPEITPVAGDPEKHCEQLKALIEKEGIDEVRAKAVAYVVGRGLGLERTSAPADYSALYNGNQKALTQSLAIIQETSAKIIDELLPEARRSGERAVAVSGRQKPALLDAEGFGRFHREYRGRVVESIAGLVRDRDKAEDIAAQAFQVGWEKREAFRGDASPHTWIQAIARNAAWDSQRRERSVYFESTDRADAREIALPELVTDELERQDERFWLQKAMDQLPGKHRRALVGHFVDGLSIRDIARQERVPDGTVLSRIHTGKQLLREAWEATFSHGDANARAFSSRKPDQAKARQAPETVGGTRPKSEPPEPATWDR
jgi:RNA polymerase sigma factor (sigma-70 family)